MFFVILLAESEMKLEKYIDKEKISPFNDQILALLYYSLICQLFYVDYFSIINRYLK
jgi:hypothetical protein